MSVPGHEQESLPLRGLHALAPFTWRLLVTLVIVLALYLSLGRLLISQVPSMREVILAGVNQHLPFELSVEKLSGSWSGFSPELNFDELMLSQPEGGAAPIALGRGSLRLDVLKSLRSLSLQLSRLELTGLSVDARLTEQGSIELLGYSRSGGAALRNWLELFLPNVERVALTDQRMRLAMGDTALDLSLNLLLEREGNARHLQGRISGDQLSVAVNAEGVGNPLRPRSWTGDVFVAAQTAELATLQGLWKTLDWPFRLRGAAAAQFWLNRADGDSTARMRWDSTGLEVEERDALWSLPIDALSFEAALDQRPRHWSLLTEDFHIERLGQVLDLSRAQFDWQGQALRIRASDLGLAALPSLLAAAPGLPRGLRDALPELAPRGHLTSIELRFDDLARPQESWQLRSLIDDLALGSWRASPALTGISGYLELQPGEGSLQLDADAVSMHFPSVYERPQFYDEAVGNIGLHWDAEGLRIDSGLLRARGDEGLAKVLFAVDVPFAERVTGVELELLVGLEDSALAYRDRYLPYKLPEPLLRWLDGSIGDGALQRAGFIWRGSVLPKNFPHMTVQLFLEARDASLRYDPAWPPLEDLDVQVWVSDQYTWARADRARVLATELNGLTVGVLTGSAGARLRIGTALSGDAAAASSLLSDSPLAALTGEAFSGWPFSGAILGKLDLELALGGEPQAPDVEVDVRFDSLSSEVAQLGLPLGAMAGELHYSSALGLEGSFLSGRALGGQFELVAEEQPEGLQLQLTGELEAEEVAKWLQLPLLDFVSGKTAMEGQLVVPKAAEDDDESITPRLELRSELLGIRLDAPAPFNKAPEQQLSLRLAMPLQVDPLIQLAIGERLRMQLALAGDTLEQLVARVGAAARAPAPTACSSRLCLSGGLSALDIGEWTDFYRRYLAAGDESLAASGGVPQLTTGGLPDTEPQSYEIDSLSVGELSVGGLRLGEARIDLWGSGDLWQGALESAAIQGSLTREDGELQLLLEYLDTRRFLGDESPGGESLSLAQLQQVLPSMRVDVLELRKGADNLGYLGFELDVMPADDALYAKDIRGELWGLQLADPAPGLLRWHSRDGVEWTSLELDATFGDLGQVLKAAGYAPTIESERGRGSLRLSWPGAPPDFAMARSEGSINLAARNGRILEDRPGALAMVSFLNFAEIIRGLSLTHMFEAGIPFIDADAQLRLQQGKLEVAALQIDGAASAFSFTGISDLAAGSIDGELLVTLPVANNLPWVAALAAGLPVAAGVFVVSKVFEKQVNRMSSAVYGVSGPIAAPEVEFRRLFDDQLSPSSATPGDDGTGGG